MSQSAHYHTYSDYETTVVGSAFGPLIGFPLCGYLSASDGGWPSIFYVTGGLGFVWVILWYWIGATSPEKHTTISKVERSYIETAIQRDVNVILVSKLIYSLEKLGRLANNIERYFNRATVDLDFRAIR